MYVYNILLNNLSDLNIPVLIYSGNNLSKHEFSVVLHHAETNDKIVRVHMKVIFKSDHGNWEQDLDLPFL